MSDAPLDPSALLATLAESGVDFVVIGALAVGVYSEVRSTGDVDVMVPLGDEDNKRALERALKKLNAAHITFDQGGVDPTAGDPYPTVMFGTRYGKLDLLYRPDGSDSYAKVKQRSVKTTIGGQPVAVVGKDDLVRMKLAAGREDDLRDVGSLTANEHGPPRAIVVSMLLSPEADHDWARDLASARVAYFDASCRVRVADGKYLQIEATRAGLTDEQMAQWARSLAERLQAAEVVADAELDIEIREA